MLGPTKTDIATAASALKDRIVSTPAVRLNSARLLLSLPEASDVIMKLELFQQAGSFKARGVLLAIDAMSSDQREAGVTAVSAGNHAIATAFAAQAAGTTAKIVMIRPNSANTGRQSRPGVSPALPARINSSRL